MKSPFVWFGGKRKVAAQVWEALGDVDNYVEPFFGSGAVLLGRPHDMGDGQRRAETVNDADGFLANFWRALSYDPEAVAHHCDWPVNEVDLFARHLWLVNTGRSILLEGMESDPDFYDAKIAGWWVWGVNAWIGSGWCAGDGPWVLTEDGVSKRPHLGDAGRGVNRKRPHLGDAGRGVNRKLPHLGDAGRAGFNNLQYRADGIASYFLALADRLRDTRVCCGDWSRVTTNGALSYGTTVGVFLDPPYLGDVRTADLYTVDDHTIANDVREWCLANGDNPRYRIVLAGYTAEHDHLMPAEWRRVRWSASAAYQTTKAAERAAAGNAAGNLANRHGECLWLSPHCIDNESGFDFGGTITIGEAS
jgi:DNA adenine methylase